VREAARDYRKVTAVTKELAQREAELESEGYQVCVVGCALLMREKRAGLPTVCCGLRVADERKESWATNCVLWAARC
jgi:hypothetical protein